MPVWLENGCIRRAPGKLPHVGDAAGDRGRRCRRRADQMRAHPRALAMLEIAVGGGDDAVARLAAVAVAAGAHRAAGLAPEETGVAEHPVEARGLGLALHRRRARDHHGDHAVGDAASAHDVGGNLQVRQPGVGAGADEHPVHRQTGKRHAGSEPHIGERALDRGFSALIGGGGRIGHAVGNSEHHARVGAPGDLRVETVAVEHDFTIELRAIVGLERAPMLQRAVPHRALRRVGPPGDPLERRSRPAQRNPSVRPSRC